MSELAGIAVFEGNMTFNVSHEMPCFLGFSADKHLPKTDFGLLVDVDVPWFPRDVTPNPDAYWAHIDVDILKPSSPMWTFPGHVRIQGNSGIILQQLVDAVKAKATPKFKEAAAARVKTHTAEHQAWRENAKKLAANKGKPDEINPHYVMAELSKLLDDDDIVFNEAVRNTGACLLQIKRPKPSTIIRLGGGGLGWSGSTALGAKKAAPDRMMVQVVGDGGFYFGNPSSVFSTAQQYKLPILSIVLDNTGWSAVKESTLRVYPSGEAKDTDEFQSNLMPTADFTKVGEAFGAYGERVTDPDELPAALEARGQGGARRPRRRAARARHAALESRQSNRPGPCPGRRRRSGPVSCRLRHGNANRRLATEQGTAKGGPDHIEGGKS